MNEHVAEPVSTPSPKYIQPGPLALIISGPSGAGKTKLRETLLRLHPEKFVPSVSVTTRDPRPGEVEGESYIFVDDAGFDGMVRYNYFLEYATLYNGKKYGTPKGDVIDKLNQGKKTILTIDVQGFEIVKKVDDRRITDNLLTMFICPPTLKDLEERLVERAKIDKISPEELARRIAAAPGEMAWKDKYDCVVTSMTGNIYGDYLQAVDHINNAMRG